MKQASKFSAAYWHLLRITLKDLLLSSQKVFLKLVQNIAKMLIFYEKDKFNNDNNYFDIM